MHVVLLQDEHEQPTPSLLAALREADVIITATTTAQPHRKLDGERESAPSIVLYEVADEAGVAEIHAAINRAVATWPGASLVACRRAAPPHQRRDQHGLEAAALVRLGFRAVADEPAQVTALLREVKAGGAVMPDFFSRIESMSSLPPPSLLLPEKLNGARLRMAFEVVAALHLVSDQKSAAQTALAGLAPLLRADRWTIYLTEEERTRQEIRFEPLAVRGLTASERALPEGDWRRALNGDALALAGAESRAARAAAVTTETMRRTEGERRVLAVPLVSGERVLGVLEVVREGARVKAFSASDARLISALAVPLTAALANSVRIAEAERLSQTDDLTKLHNARFLRQYLISEVKRARRYDSTVTAMFLDLDDFKEVNDCYGHLVGSHVLMELASVILMCVRDTDIVSRYGGDEFVVILPETDREQAAAVAERVRDKIARQVFTGGRNLNLKLTASFGVASFPRHSQSPQQLIADADAAMYEAKAARKNCVRFAAEPHK